MAWTFAVFAFIPACFLLSIFTLAPQGFADNTQSLASASQNTAQTTSQNAAETGGKGAAGASGKNAAAVVDATADKGGLTTATAPTAAQTAAKAEEFPTCAACIATSGDPLTAKGKWCMKTYPKTGGAAAAVHANFCVPKSLTSDSCLGGQLVTECPKKPFHLSTNYSNFQAEPDSCTACHTATGKWCVRGATGQKSRFCVPLTKLNDCTTTVVDTFRGEELGACTTNDPNLAVTAIVGLSAAERTCGDCIKAGTGTEKAWCLKDYSAEHKASHCVVDATVGSCLGGTKIKVAADCPTVGKDRNQKEADIGTCDACMETHKQKWCLKSVSGSQFRACIPTDATTVCPNTPTAGTTAPANCGAIKTEETSATLPTEPTQPPAALPEEAETTPPEDQETEAPKTLAPTTPKPATTTKAAPTVAPAAATEAPEETSTPKSAAATAGALTASVLAMLVAAA